MDKQSILNHVDHTILKPEATWEQVRQLCDDAIWGQTASVCIPPCFVSPAAEYLNGRLTIGTVIGFPHGNVDTAVKAFEMERALSAGAGELDMVIRLGLVKEGRWDALLDELRVLRAAAQNAQLKVIVECCLLTETEKCRLCDLVVEAEADYIKTSTGFSTGGASVADVALFHKLAPTLKIKAAGGIRTFEAAQALLDAGADRIGSSALVALFRGETG